MTNIKKLRGKKGLSQLELANTIGVARTFIVRLEGKKIRNIGKKTEKKLCDFFEVSPCELYGIDNLKHYPKTKEELAKLISLLNEEYEKWDS